MTDFFEGIPKITYEGPDSDNEFAFRHYNPDEMVMGKRMADHLRFAVAYWHSFAWPGGDPFGGQTFERPWFGDNMKDARLKADVAFEMFDLLNAPYFCFHDLDARPEGASFAESRANKDNPKADWYVWADPKPDGTPPTNWLSIFGGPAWQWDGRRMQYYLHNFLTSQPDLNFHTPAVQDALLDVARFWLDRGVDGFRLDTINFYFHDQQLRNNPPLPEEMRNATIAPQVNPYNHQEHLYDRNRPENLAFLRRLRSVMKPYGAAAVGEVGDAQKGLEIMGEYTAGDDLMNMCYAFEFLANDVPNADQVVTVMDRVDRVAADGWPCWAFSNHDVKRHASRWEMGDSALRMMTTLMMCWRGSACIYQGEELGLTEADIAFEDLQDPYGIEFWPEFKGRDGCRTPMVWERDNREGGFSEGKPWLPVAREHLNNSVTEQEGNPEALLHHYRRAIGLRRDNPALASGDHNGIQASGNVIHFIRTLGTDEIFCAFNMGDEDADIALPKGEWAPLAADLDGVQDIAGPRARLAPWQICIAKKKS